MDPNRPEATHVAVRDGRILAVGDATCADQWGDVTHDDSLADNVLMPGLVEGHAHMMAGAMWNYAYAGVHDRMDPKGNWVKGKPDIATVISDLSEQEKSLPEGAPLLGWGLDPIFFEGERLSRRHLDQISSERPVAIMFSNFHLMCVNTKALELAGYDRSTNAEGVVKDAQGDPTGELQEMAAMFPVMRRVGMDFRGLTQKPETIRTYAEVCMRAGVTTTTDLYAQMEGDDVETLLAVTSEDAFCTRLVSVMGVAGTDPEQSAAQALEMRERSTDKLRLGAVKLMTDGAIQGWTARVKWPGYVGGQPNGIWNMAPAEIHRMVAEMQKAGVQMHIHVNGDEASEVAIDALAAAACTHPWPGARHVLQHCQLMGRDQFERCVELDVCCNIFSNHIWYFGDKHVEQTIGEQRALRMDAARTALDTGVHMAIHSDAPVTHLGPLFTAWVAVNRQTMSGRVLGEAQQITVPEALHAITMGAAYTLKMDSEIGSIEPGKRADLAILGDDPLAVDPAALKDVPVLGTVLSGQVTFA
ncbi:amidohydrolase [Lutimaribacter sp. EGI FJ00015]|uniref:Amidohydrolase n=1 Tax=Lutimaribacter degradans TaxID=2945989 RepID=A0ACC5ZY92_9RHOB|nr:amidohydrolase [Lutimaribacter sp. EGI FJ00013]MCM2563314.1 amidohydrolase [Lutimaribacter sp. EGI FJ00013]MCO0614363.1 amidohydrolase [Lutimaribacter sp. EGI FJ00015]MCO0636036.1 amidohydrolase [Lutimaribacter sp. EGI FJ00014]